MNFKNLILVLTIGGSFTLPHNVFAQDDPCGITGIAESSAAINRYLMNAALSPFCSIVPSPQRSGISETFVKEEISKFLKDHLHLSQPYEITLEHDKTSNDLA